jgi:hypothetical protein
MWGNILFAAAIVVAACFGYLVNDFVHLDRPR